MHVQQAKSETSSQDNQPYKANAVGYILHTTYQSLSQNDKLALRKHPGFALG